MVVLAAGRAFAQADGDELPVERRAYRVRVLVSFAGEAPFTPQFRKEVIAEISQQIDRTLGPMWDDEVLEGPRFAGRAGLARMSDDAELA